MIKRLCKVIIPLLALLAIVLPSCATSVYADDGKKTFDGKSYLNNEVLDKRTEYGKTYFVENPPTGGTRYILITSANSIHYKDNYNNPSETWKDIDLTFVNGQITKAPYTLTVYPDCSISWQDKKSYAYVSVDLSTIGGIAPKSVAAVYGKNTVKWNDVATDTDIEIEANNTGVRIKRILKSNKAPLNVEFDISEANSPNIKYLGMMPANIHTKVPVIASKVGGKLTETIDMTELSKGGTVTYPLVVDPSIDIAGVVNSPATLYWTGAAWAGWAVRWYWSIGYYGAANQKEGGGVTWQSVTVPNSATINSAHITLEGFDARAADTARSYIVGEDADNSAAWTTQADYQARRGTDCGGADNTKRTTAEVAWNPMPDFTDGGFFDTPDIKTIVAEITTRAGWASSNNMTFFIDDYDDNSTHAAIRDRVGEPEGEDHDLYIDYTASGAPSVSTLAATNVEATTATLTGNITALGSVANCNARGFEWGTTSNVTLPAATQEPRTTPYTANYTEFGSFGVGTFTYGASGLSTGTTYYYRAYAHDAMSANYTAGWGYGAEASFLTKPAAPTNVAATDGTWTNKVVITWTKSTGATNYRVYRNGVDISGLLGDVATYDDTTAAAGTINAGTITASDGTVCAHVILTSAGESTNNGTTYTYYVVASNATGNSSNSASDTGYRGIGAITYQWLRSAADADAGYGNIAGATTNPYNDTGAPADGSGRWYYVTYSATGAAASVDSNHDRGFRNNAEVDTLPCSGTGKAWAIINGIVTSTGGGASITNPTFEYGTTTALGTTVTKIGTFALGATFSYNLIGLSPATVYYYRASGTCINGDIMNFATSGSPNLWESYTATCNWTSQNTYSSNITFQTFTSDSTAHTIASVKLHLRRVGSPGNVYCSIRYANAGSTEPTGADIDSAVLNGNAFSTTYTWYEFVFDEPVALEADTPYAIVLQAPSGDASNYVQWCGNSAGGEPDGRAGHTSDAGMTWTSDAPVDLLFEIWGYASLIITNPNVFTNYIEVNDWLVVGIASTIYAPYYNNHDDPAAYFYLQLVDANTNQIKASTPIRYWDRQPTGLYLRASQTTGLTWQGDYYLRIQFQHDATIYQETTIGDIDWRGDDMHYLDQWIRTTCDELEVYYGEYDANTQIFVDAVYLVKSDKGTVLNQDGGVLYARGIPALTRVRPSIFESVQQLLTYDALTFTGAGDIAATEWENRVGAKAVTEFNLWANAMGMDSSKVLAGGLLVLVYLILAGAIGIGHPFTGMALGLPFLFGCWAFGIMYSGAFFVIVGIMAIMLIVKLAGSVGSG